MSATTASNPSSSRLVSLDAFRGAVILLMVLVNAAGGLPRYTQLEHADWHGWTLTDTVFPSFLWIVGVSITLSFTRRLQGGLNRVELIPQILRRAAILFALGMFIYLFPDFDWSHARILGVLQRIAICYLFTSLIYLWIGVRGQIVCIVILFTAYWLLMSLGGSWDLEGNFAHHVDFVVLGQHNFRLTKTWDPEGIVSTIPSIATCLFGVLAGHLLRLNTSLARRTAWLFFFGCLLLLSGEILSAAMPINKKLWTDSFVLFMAGLDFLAFGCFLWFVDELGLKKWVRPFLIAGMNSIAIYVISEILAEAIGGAIHRDIYNTMLVPYFSRQNASLGWALAYTLLIYFFAYLLYRKSWFWRV